MDITLYRDDWTRIGPHPVVQATDIAFTLEGKRVVLVDDSIVVLENVSRRIREGESPLDQVAGWRISRHDRRTAVSPFSNQ